MTLAPTLTTARLTLRTPSMGDFPALETFYASPRAEGVGGPFGTADVWKILATFVGGWSLIGTGWWAVAERATPDAAIGFVGVHQPPHKSEREIGWMLYQNAEGKGFAFEAAKAAFDWAIATLPADTLVSYIDNTNTRSQRLAARLGARADGPAAHSPADQTTWRYDLEAVQ